MARPGVWLIFLEVCFHFPLLSNLMNTRTFGTSSRRRPAAQVHSTFIIFAVVIFVFLIRPTKEFLRGILFHVELSPYLSSRGSFYGGSGFICTTNYDLSSLQVRSRHATKYLIRFLSIGLAICKSSSERPRKVKFYLLYLFGCWIKKVSGACSLMYGVLDDSCPGAAEMAFAEYIVPAISVFLFGKLIM